MIIIMVVIAALVLTACSLRSEEAVIGNSAENDGPNIVTTIFSRL